MREAVRLRERWLDLDGCLVCHQCGVAALELATNSRVLATIEAIAGHLIPSYLPVAPVRVLAFGLAITFAGRAIGDFRLVGLFKRVRGTGFAKLDTWIYAPLCLGLGVAIFFVAYNAT